MSNKVFNTKVQYDQEVVNTSLTEVFDMDPMINNQKEIIKKKPGRGGKRIGAGRKTGTTNKIQGVEFLEEYKRLHGSSLVEDLAKDMQDARNRGDYDMLFKYQTAFSKYYFADTAKQEVDVTSNGQTLGASFTFPTLELPDWSHEPIKH
jgi:hypothetical protein